MSSVAARVTALFSSLVIFSSCSIESDRPSADEARLALQPYFVGNPMQMQGRGSAFLIDTGSPTDCREANSPMGAVTACSVCLTTIEIDWTVASGALGVYVAKGDYAVTFSRAISHNQPTLRPTNDTGVWVVAQSILGSSIVPPGQPRFRDNLDSAVLAPAGITFERHGSHITLRSSDGMPLGHARLAPFLSSPEVRQSVRSTYGGCEDPLPTRAPTSTEAATAQGSPVPAQGEQPRGERSSEIPPDEERCEYFVSEQELQRRLDQRPIDPAVNRIRLSGANSISWNNTSVNLATLRQYLDISTQMTPPPLFVVQPQPGTSEANVRRVREVIWGTMGCLADTF